MEEKLKDRGWLKQKYVDENLSMSQIGSLLGCSKHSIYRALKRHGLQARAHTSKYPALNDKGWLENVYCKEKQSIKQISETVGCSVGVVHSALTHMGIKTRNPKESLAVKYENGRFGVLASNWRGGRRKTTSGHIYAYNPAHPYANKSGLVMEHRLLMEASVGRYLLPEEVVHHINGIKEDNRLENLQLLPNQSEHLRLHFAAIKEVGALKERILELETQLRGEV